MTQSTQQEFTNWLSTKDWHIFATIVFNKIKSDETINKKMEYISNHYTISDMVWFREYTTNGIPHVHMLIKTNKLLKAYRKLPLEFKKYGMIDFQLFDQNQAVNCINYISKDYNKSNNPLWNAKMKIPYKNNIIYSRNHAKRHQESQFQY